MTRDSDTFIPLRERVAIGRARQGGSDDLAARQFQSRIPTSAALSIYTLNDGRSDREAAALARRENQSDVIAGVDSRATTIRWRRS